MNAIFEYIPLHESRFTIKILLSTFLWKYLDVSSTQPAFNTYVRSTYSYLYDDDNEIVTMKMLGQQRMKQFVLSHNLGKRQKIFV